MGKLKSEKTELRKKLKELEGKMRGAEQKLKSENAALDLKTKKEEAKNKKAGGVNVPKAQKPKSLQVCNRSNFAMLLVYFAKFYSDFFRYINDLLSFFYI